MNFSQIKVDGQNDPFTTGNCIYWAWPILPDVNVPWLIPMDTSKRSHEKPLTFNEMAFWCVRYESKTSVWHWASHVLATNEECFSSVWQCFTLAKLEITCTVGLRRILKRSMKKVSRAIAPSYCSWMEWGVGVECQNTVKNHWSKNILQLSFGAVAKTNYIIAKHVHMRPFGSITRSLWFWTVKSTITWLFRRDARWRAVMILLHTWDNY